jgi:hypothetical protein
MISRCSEARERTVNRSEWSSETTTDDTTAGYRRTPATSIDAMLTMFLVGTAEKAGGPFRFEQLKEATPLVSGMYCHAGWSAGGTKAPT